MTREEFLSTIKSRGAILAPGVDMGKITIVNTALQRYRAAMLPMYMIDLYTAIGGINMGSGYIFGPTEEKYNNTTYPIPSIITINQEIANIPSMRAKTVFGQNDLFWFCFDSFGTCFMLEKLTLKPLRKYNDPYRALLDCLAGGKI